MLINVVVLNLCQMLVYIGTIGSDVLLNYNINDIYPMPFSTLGDLAGVPHFDFGLKAESSHPVKLPLIVV